MQVSGQDRKQIFCNALGKVLSKLQAENHLSARAISYDIEISKTTFLLAQKGHLDPQLSTFCKFAEAFNLKPSELLKTVESELSEGWSFCD